MLLPFPPLCGEVAQSVEQRTENSRVVGSIPTLATIPFMIEQREIRRRQGLARLAANIIPGLPVDADPSETRNPMPRLDAVLPGVMAALACERNAFFDSLSDRWPSLFPDIPARPGRFSEGRVYLYVRSSATLFALRPKLREIRAKLAALDGAPKRFEVRLEIHA